MKKKPGEFSTSFLLKLIEFEVAWWKFQKVVSIRTLKNIVFVYFDFFAFN